MIPPRNPKRPTATAPRPQGRHLTPEESVVLSYRMALERFVDPGVRGSHEAYTMAYNAIRWLILKEPTGLESARRWLAQVQGFSGPDSDAAVIVQIEWQVRVALDIRCGDGTFGEPTEAVKQLRAALVSRFSDSNSIPSETELADWLERHAPSRARGKITTAGIVARIVHRGRLLGARGTEQKTLERVTKALDPKRHPRW